jgi:MoxR-like ATPase
MATRLARLAGQIDELEIGGVVRRVAQADPLHGGAVPLSRENLLRCAQVVELLRWLMQKENLAQDVFLVGEPGPLRRWLVLAYCELLGREVEYVALSRDTTESELKQRREIRDGSVEFVDQACVRAALHGRVLLLDGIEKVERNVLPLLNNLLENRELNLDDGTMLLDSNKYDALARTQTAHELESLKLRRVSENFRVVALGVPVPRYAGFPLDPPLRSRFQARRVEFELASLLCIEPPLREAGVAARVHALATFHLTLHRIAENNAANGVPQLLESSFIGIVRQLNLFPESSEFDLVRLIARALPYSVMPAWHVPVEHVLARCSLREAERGESNYEAVEVQHDRAYFLRNTPGLTAPVAALEHRVHLGDRGRVPFVQFVEHSRFLTEMLQDRIAGFSMCVIGEKGCGKSHLLRAFAAACGYGAPATLHLYRDMSAHELIQRRATDSRGNTVWLNSPLVEACLRGELLVLDGIHQLHPACIGVLQSFFHEGELRLLDGGRLVSEQRYDSLVKSVGEKVLERERVFRVHPSTCVIAASLPPSANNSWLSAETLSLFRFHCMPPLNESALLQRILATAPIEHTVAERMVSFAERMRGLVATAEIGVQPLSLRELLRCARVMARYRNANLRALLSRAILLQCAPARVQLLLEQLMDECGIAMQQAEPSSVRIEANSIRIGDVVCARRIGGNAALIPSPLFYEMPAHIRHLGEMLMDFELGHHLLLIGNQGVGKNKLADRMLELLGCEREYVQLHRDTTVRSLTVAPLVSGGVLSWQDSPLVRAVKNGRVLVVDEADKAPLEVVSILKGLVEDGTMFLADGRRIVPHEASKPHQVAIHPGFRVIVLANRPGYPFLGNDFFAACGDCFAPHLILNPDAASERALLRSYAPSVSVESIALLVDVFNELRTLVHDGVLAYPFSTRELVQILKHMHSYPSDGVGAALANVFDFDSFAPPTLEQLERVLRKHGIAMHAQQQRSELSRERILPPARHAASWRFDTLAHSLSAKVVPVLILGQFAQSASARRVGAKQSARLETFGERKWSFSIETQRDSSAIPISDMIIVNGSIYVLVAQKPQQPCEIRCYPGPKFDEYSSIPIGKHAPNVGDFKLAPASEFDGVMAWSASTNIFLICSTTQIAALEVILLGASIPTAIFGEKFYVSGAQNKNPRWRMSHGLLNEEEIVLFWRNDFKLLVVHLMLMSSCLLDIPEHLFERGEQLQSANAFGDARILLCTNRKLAIIELLSAPSEWSSQQNVALSYRIVLSSALGDGATSLPPREDIVMLSGDCIVTARHVHALTLGRERGEVSTRTGTAGNVNAAARSKQHIVICSENQDRSTIELIDEQNNSLLQLDERAVCAVSVHEREAFVALRDGAVLCIELDRERLHSELGEWNSLRGEKQSLVVSGKRKGKKVNGEGEGEGDGEGEGEGEGDGDGDGEGDGDGDGEGDGDGKSTKPRMGRMSTKSVERRRATPEEIAALSEASKRASKIDASLAQADLEPHDAMMYSKHFTRVAHAIAQLGVIFDAAQAKALPRVWLAHRSHGELDDRKLVEAVIGDSNIYKMPGIETHSSVQLKPKRISFVVDISASMYRFNAEDGRLDRAMDVVLMLMEALHGRSQRFEYEIVGHSGEKAEVELVACGASPASAEERLRVLKKMQAHAEYCASGDNTLEALALARDKLARCDADERLVIVVSDANLDRYGIEPERLAVEMKKQPSVECYCVFIAAEPAAARSVEKMNGRAWLCTELENMPNIVKQILRASVLSNA